MGSLGATGNTKASTLQHTFRPSDNVSPDIVYWLPTRAKFWALLFTCAVVTVPILQYVGKDSLYILPYKVPVVHMQVESTSNGAISASNTDPDVVTLSSPRHTHWLLFDSRGEDVCDKLRDRFDGWRILLTGSSESTQNVGCEYFPASDTKSRISPLKHAIKNGAKTIYVAGDPFREGLVPSKPVGAWREQRNIVYRQSESQFYDPLFSWGCGPLRKKTNKLSANYEICTDVKVGIRTVVNISPKLSSSDSPMTTTCDSGSAAMVLESGIYAFLPPKGILFNEHALWALPVVWSSNIKVAMVVQKLLWLSGNYVNVRSAPMLIAGRVLNDTTALSYLNNYQCPPETTNVHDCTQSLLSSLHNTKLRMERELSDMLEWFVYLDHQNYQYPDITSPKDFECSKRQLAQYFGSNPKLPSPNDKVKLTNTNEDLSQYSQKSLCTNETLTHPNLHDSLVPVWDDILLVITFNNNFYISIPYLEMLYRKMFPHILYCAPTGAFKPDQEDAIKHLDLTFVFYHETPAGQLHGSFFYECGVLAAAMRYDVRGYLVVSDDVLMVPRHMQSYDRDKLWFLPLKNHVIGNYVTRSFTNIGAQKREPLANFPTFKRYETQTKAAMAQIQHMTSDNARHCVSRLINITGTADRPLSSFTDAWYIPATKIDAVAELMTVFVENDSYLSIVLGTVFNCVTEPSEYLDLQSIYATKMNWFRLPGHMTKKQNRNNVWEFIHPGNIHFNDVMHPYKLSSVHKRIPQHVHYFCRFLDFLYDPEGKFIL